MNNYHTYLQICPVLSDEEMELFDLFNKILILKFQMTCPDPAIWLPDTNDPETFEVINNEKDKINIENNLEQSLSRFQSSCDNERFLDNFELIMNYKDIFFKTEIIQKYQTSYQLNYYSSNLPVHLLKVVNFFHGNGLFKKLLSLNVQEHTFSQVIANESSSEVYIIDNLDIYDAMLLENGYYKKEKNISKAWSENLYSNINKKIFHDELSSKLLYTKVIKDIQKI